MNSIERRTREWIRETVQIGKQYENVRWRAMVDLLHADTGITMSKLKLYSLILNEEMERRRKLKIKTAQVLGEQV